LYGGENAVLLFLQIKLFLIMLC